MMLPMMNGSEMVEVATSNNDRISKCLFMSGYSNQSIANRETPASDTTMLEKPFTASILLQAACTALGSP